MTETRSLEDRISILFRNLETKSQIANPGYLSSELSSLVDKADKINVNTLSISTKISSLYATAAVEIWLRGIHSFLISSALVDVSPIWSSVSGYYASHYCIRGLAHLLGFFQLHRKKRIVRIDIVGGKYLCFIDKKGGSEREHRYYWKVVKNHIRFASDPFFTINVEDSSDSDSGHRNIANYFDHINGFTDFHPLNREILKQRIDHLSKIELSSVPIPRKGKYPDVENVQLIAYHRIIKFRSLLDEILGDKNGFWKIHRNPRWCIDFLNFQAVTPRFLKIYDSIV
jgi:hypothetical protein